MTTTPKPDDPRAKRLKVLTEMMAQYSPEAHAKGTEIAVKLRAIGAARKAQPTKAGETDEPDAP